MKFYLMIRFTDNDWKCLHRGSHDECRTRGMELDDHYDWAIFQEVRYSYGKEVFTLT